MGKNEIYEKWYVVKTHTHKYLAHVFNDYGQASAFAKSKKTVCKRFTNREQAVEYAGCKENKICFHKSNTNSHPSRICLICEKPFKGRTKLCPTCNKLRGNMSVTTAVAIKSFYPDKDVFELREKEPYIVYKIGRQLTKVERSEIRKNRGATFRSEEYKNEQYSKSSAHVPDYIRRLFEKDETKELLYVEGDKLNPNIYYVCKKCGVEQCQEYQKLKIKAGHNCEAEKSSGEVVVEEYLKKKNVHYKTQFDTLRCINPKTKKVMPYDFELPKHRIIIEVQGKQHLEYIPYFHGSEENFQYQLWRDGYKKMFAEKKGFVCLCISYKDIQSGAYKEMLDSAIVKREKAQIL